VKVKDQAITGAKVKDGTLTGKQVDVSTLGTVPSAENAQVASSLTAGEPWHEVGTPSGPEFKNGWGEHPRGIGPRDRRLLQGQGRHRPSQGCREKARRRES
jgi:hypothetical protein